MLVIPLHGHLAPAAWAAGAGRRRACGSATCRPPAGRCPGRSPATWPSCASRGILCGHITAAPAYGGEQEALSVAGALDAAATGSAGTR